MKKVGPSLQLQPFFAPGNKRLERRNVGNSLQKVGASGDLSKRLERQAFTSKKVGPSLLCCEKVGPLVMNREKVGASLLSPQKVGASRKGWSVGPFSQKVGASVVSPKRLERRCCAPQRLQRQGDRANAPTFFTHYSQNIDNMTNGDGIGG